MNRITTALIPGRHFKTYFLILLVVIFSPLGNVLLSTGMKQVGPMTFHTASEFVSVFARVFTSGAIWLGIASLFAYFISSAGLVLGRLQLRAASHGDGLRDRSPARAFRFARNSHTSALDWNIFDLSRRAHSRPHPTAHDEAQLMLKELVFFF